MNRLTSLLLLLILSVSCFAQERALKIEKGKFYIDNERTSINDFVLVMESNQEAYDLAMKAKSSYSAGNVFGFIGGFMVGWPLGTAVVGGQPKWELAWAGLGVLGISIPLLSSANKKMEKAVSVYENGTQSQSNLRLRLAPTKLGITYTF